MGNPADPQGTKLTFIGTGEACDPHRHNSSVFLEFGSQSILLDCGFSAAKAFLALADPMSLDAVWFSHMHGDHFFGFPQLAAYYYMQKRVRELVVLSTSDCREKVLTAIDLAYEGLSEKLTFPLTFKTLPSGSSCKYLEMTLRSVEVEHSGTASGLRLDAGMSSIYFSGDGRPTPAAVELMRGCDLIIHEGFSMTVSKKSHFSVTECLELAKQEAFPRMAVIHISRETRTLLERMEKSVVAETTGKQLFFPDDGDVIYLP